MSNIGAWISLFISFYTLWIFYNLFRYGSYSVGGRS